jgi:hypothetical protein
MPINVNGYEIDLVSSRQHSYDGIVRAGLVLHLDAATFNTVTGTTWYDLSGNSNNAILTNGPTYNSSNGGYISFDGVNDYAPFSSEYAFSTGNGTDYSFEIWFKMRTLPTVEYGVNGHIWGGENGNDVVLYLGPASNGVSKGIIVYDDSRYAAPGMQTTGGFTANTWSHWVITGNGTSNTVTHYINGTLDKLNGAVSPSSQYVKPWGGTRFAYDSRWGTYSTLDLAVARQYNRALSSTEVAINYNALKGRFGL